MGYIIYGLINSIEQRYSLPSNRYFSDTLIPEMYRKVKEKVTDLAKEKRHDIGIGIGLIHTFCYQDRKYR